MTTKAGQIRHGGDIYTNKHVKYDFSVSLSPIGPPPGAVRAVQEAASRIAHYPDPQCRELRSEFSRYLQVPQEQILFGNGASALIRTVCQTQIETQSEVQNSDYRKDNKERFVETEKAAEGSITNGNAKAAAKHALLPAPTYMGYERELTTAGFAITRYALRSENNYALTEEFTTYIRKWHAAHPAGTNLIFLCDPNNPTGSCISEALLVKILQTCHECGIRCVLDACYADLTPYGSCSDQVSETAHNSITPADTCSDRIPEVTCCDLTQDDAPCDWAQASLLHDLCRYLTTYPTLVILGAFTKTYAMPGLRLGYLISTDTAFLEEAAEHLEEWSVSLPAQEAGLAALKDKAYLPRARRVVYKERAFLTEKMQALGLKVYPGDANFVFFASVKELCEPLADSGILIRDCSDMMAHIMPQEQCKRMEQAKYRFYRIGIRAHCDNMMLVEALERCMNW